MISDGLEQDSTLLYDVVGKKASVSPANAINKSQSSYTASVLTFLTPTDNKPLFVCVQFRLADLMWENDEELGKSNPLLRLPGGAPNCQSTTIIISVSWLSV